MHNSIPDFDHAFSESCEQAFPETWKKTWSHPVVMHAFRQVGRDAFEDDDDATCRAKFRAAYEQACLDYKAGKIANETTQKVKSIKDEIDALLTAPDQPITRYEFCRPGVLKQYAHLKGYEDSIKVIRELLKTNPNPGVEKLVDGMEERYLARKAMH